jgi:hypothetical protein
MVWGRPRIDPSIAFDLAYGIEGMGPLPAGWKTRLRWAPARIG